MVTTCERCVNGPLTGDAAVVTNGCDDSGICAGWLACAPAACGQCGAEALAYGYCEIQTERAQDNVSCPATDCSGTEITDTVVPVPVPVETLPPFPSPVNTPTTATMPISSPSASSSNGSPVPSSSSGGGSTNTCFPQDEAMEACFDAFEIREVQKSYCEQCITYGYRAVLTKGTDCAAGDALACGLWSGCRSCPEECAAEVYAYATCEAGVERMEEFGLVCPALVCSSQETAVFVNSYDYISAAFGKSMTVRGRWWMGLAIAAIMAAVAF